MKRNPAFAGTKRKSLAVSQKQKYKQMNKIIIIISFLLVLPATIFAQDNKHELVLGYGTVTNYAIDEEMQNIIGIIISLGIFDAEYESGTGAIILGYRYYASEKFSIGIDGIYTKIKDILKFQSDEVGNLERHFYTLAPCLAYHYIKHRFSQPA